MSAFGSLADIAAYQSKVRLTLAGFVAARGNDENGRRQQNNNHPKADETSLGRRESGAFCLVTDVGSGKSCG